jgi:regulatory protein
LDLLARREYAARELEAKLEQRGFAAEDVRAVTAQLTAENLLSDARCAEAAVRAGVARGRGPLRLHMALQRRGIDEALIDQALEEAQVDWSALATEARRKRFGEGMPGDFKEKARQTRFLRYRGFTGNQVRHALEED